MVKTEQPDLNSAEYWSGAYRRYFCEGDLWTIYKERQRAWRRVSTLLPHSGKLLDVGCGAGGFLAYASLSRPRLQLYGVDYAEAAVVMGGDTLSGIAQLVVGNAANLPFPAEYFSAVYSGHLIEHLQKPLDALRQQVRVLKRGGQLICHFPHGDSPYIEHVHHGLQLFEVAAWLREAGLINVFEGELPVIPGPPVDEAIIHGWKP